MHLPRLLAGLLLSATLLSAADPVDPADLLRLEDYLEQAAAANPDLIAFARRYDAAVERVPQLKALPDPMLQVSHFVQSVETRTGPQRNAIMLSQRLPWFGRLANREAGASAEAEALWFAWQNRQLLLSRQVAQTYYDFAFNTKATVLTRANLELLQRLDPIVEERSRTGGTLNALLRLRVETGRLGDQLATLESQHRQLAARLTGLLALPADTTLPAPAWDPVDNAPAGPAPSPTALAPAIETTNPELQMLERRLASTEARRELSRLESRPDVTVGVNYIDVGPARTTPTPADSGSDPWNVFVAVNLPIWGGRSSAASREGTALHAAAEAQLADRRLQLQAEARATADALADALRRVALHHDELLPLARQAADNSRTAYETGGATLLELIDSERSLLALELSLARAATDAAQNRVHLLTLANQPL